MKILNSSPISSFGGLNLVLDRFNKIGIGNFLNDQLPSLPTQTRYSWKDIFYSFWSVLFCGGDCAEDLAGNFRNSLLDNPFMQIPSPDRVLGRMKDLAEPKQTCIAKRGHLLHEFGLNSLLVRLNLDLIKRLKLLNSSGLTLDYDNTAIFTHKSDAKKNYKNNYCYYPGVGTIGDVVVYVENKNGDSDAQTLQEKTLERMFQALDQANIKITNFRADGASYQMKTLLVAAKNTENIYIRARKDPAVMKAIATITNWEEKKLESGVVHFGSTKYIPFSKRAGSHKLTHELKPYRLVVYKVKNTDGQINMYTGEACDYYAIVTNDYAQSPEEIVNFYNHRGTSEKEFDIMKNDFGWDNMPFSKLEQNAVYLILCAMCRNLYAYLIRYFSRTVKNLSPEHRIKKFIFRFICIPGKWVKSGGSLKLRLFGTHNSSYP